MVSSKIDPISHFLNIKEKFALFLLSGDVQEVAFDVKPHGNSKGGNPFMPQRKV